MNTQYKSVSQTKITRNELSVAIVLPFLGLISIDFFGQLYLNEAVFLAALPLAFLFKTYTARSDGLNQLLIALLFWLGAQILTDWVRSSMPVDYLRGWARIVFFGVSIVTIHHIIKKAFTAAVWIITSAIAGGLRSFQLFSDEMDINILWKFGLGNAALYLICAPFLVHLANTERISTNQIRRIAQLHILLGLTSFLLNARSFAGITLFAGIILYIYSSDKRPRLSAIHAPLVMGLALFASYILISFYSWGAAGGYFGQEAKDKFDSQYSSVSGFTAIIIGGRSESLVSLKAIEDSPILGHGSWARNIQYTLMLLDLKREFSEDNSSAHAMTEGADLIPSHSYLLGAWVEAGIIGAIFWIYLLYKILFVFLPLAWNRTSAIGVIFFMTAPQLIWNIFFSPFGSYQRTEVASFIAVYLLLLHANNSMNKTGGYTQSQATL